MVRSVEYEKGSFEDRYEVIRELGSGHFAVVRQCVEKATGQAYAAKFIRKRRQKFSRRGAALEDIDNEIALLSSLKHDNIISLHQVFHDDNHVILVLELVSGGELFHYLSERDHLSEEDASIFVQQILFGLDHLHQHGIAHLDLKPENILLRSAESQVIKIIDFGLAKRLDHTTNGGKEVKCMMGTAEFVAPEVVNYEALSLQTDMWSVGVITYMLLSGSSPFAGQDQQETFANITRVEFDFDEEVFSTTSDLAKDLIKHLLVREPRKRFTPKQALEHPWIRPRNSQQAVKRKASAINMTRLKAFSAKRRWQKSLRVVKLCNRLSKGNRPSSTASILSNDGSSNETLDMPENFVTRAIFCAVEDGNRQGLERLLSMATVDLSTSNELGITAAHVAAGAGRSHVLSLLHETYRLSVTSQDHYGDTPLHWAARQGHKETLTYLLVQNVDVSVLNLNQESALSQAVRYGHKNLFADLLTRLDPTVINALNTDGDGNIHLGAWYGSSECLSELLKNDKVDRNLQNAQNETALHIAASKGALSCMEVLVKHGASCELPDASGWAPLVTALKNSQPDAVSYLLEKTKLTIVDKDGNSLLHHAAEMGDMRIVELLMEKHGDMLKKVSNNGATPLHQAARHGHLEITRLLCAAGADVEALDAEGLSAEVAAYLNGHKDIGDFLKTLSDPSVRVKLLNELKTKGGPLGCFTVRVLGHPRVGKTSFVKSLQNSSVASFVRKGSAFFRRNGKKPAPTKSSSMTNMHQMRHGYPLFCTTCISLAPEFDMAVFELSADPLCLQMYDHLVKYTECLNIVMFSLAESTAVQRQQVSFWLRLLSLSFTPEDTLGFSGKPTNAPVVLLVGTHADTVKCSKDKNGLVNNPMAFTLVENMRKHFGCELTILPNIFVVDNSGKLAGSNLTMVKTCMLSIGKQLRARQEMSSVLLRKVQDRLPVWRASRLLLVKEKFLDTIQKEVNQLLTAKHAEVLVRQLVFIGEIAQVNGDHVIISPHHLFNQLIMPFLYGQVQLKNSRSVFRSRDLHFIFTNYWHNTVEVTEAMKILGTCVQTGVGDSTQIEFPALVDNSVMKPSFSSVNNTLSVRMKISDFPSYPLLAFPRLLSHMKIHTISNRNFQGLQFFFRGLRLKDSLIISWNPQAESIEICGKGDVSVVKDVCSAVEAAVTSLLPGALLESTVYVNGQQVPCFPMEDFKIRDLPLPLVSRLCRYLDPRNAFGQDWCLLAVKLGLYDRLMPKLINSSPSMESMTSLLLKEWTGNPEVRPTVQNLLDGLEQIERVDVANVLRKFLPVYKFVLDGSLLEVTSPSSPSDKTLSSMSSSVLSR